MSSRAWDITRVAAGVLFNIAWAERIHYEDRAAAPRPCAAGNDMVPKQTRILLTILLSATLVSHGAANVPVKIEDATSPDGRFQLEGIGVGKDEGCQIAIKSLPKGNVVGRFSHGDFQASDSRYHISAVWNKDSSAFALNIDEGRNITVSRVFAKNGGTWKEADLPGKAIDQVRAQANTEGGKAQDYFSASEWMSGSRLKFTYQGNTGEQYEVICRLTGGAKPRLAFVETIAPEAEPEPKYDYENYVFTVLAGGKEGSEDGRGATAQFKWPHGLAVDSTGNVFVADRGNHLIRKISQNGIVTTLAGSPGKYGRVDGTGEGARFWYPVGIAVDASGNVYVADSSGQAVRKVTPAGAVSTLAGTPETEGRKLGFGSVDHFHNPLGIALDRDGNVFVADSNNFVIRKVTPDGSVTTVAGQPGAKGTTDGEAKSARFNFPSGVAFDGKGNLYVVDRLTVRRIDARGMVTTLAGAPDQEGSSDGTGSAALFRNPQAIAVDSAGNVYVADDGNKNIRKITPGGVVKTLRGIHDESPFARPVAIAVDDKGSIYVADENAFNIVVGKPAE
jgi:sugar lactone lactonase YvrE